VQAAALIGATAAIFLPMTLVLLGTQRQVRVELDSLNQATANVNNNRRSFLLEPAA